MPPLRFIVIAGSVVVLLHAYIGARLFPALALNLPALLAGWLVLMVSALLQPLVLLRENLPHALRDRLSWVALLAMGLFSSLFVLTALRDLVLLVLGVLEGSNTTGSLPPVFMADSAQLVIALALLASVLGFFNARRLARVVEVDVPLRGLPAALHGFRIAQISDIHVGPTIKRRYLERIVARVNSLEADLVAVTGDLVDGRVRELTEHTAPLAQLRSRHGSYFVTGNHEYYSNAPEWIAEVRRLGLTVLMNEHVVLDHDGAPLVLAGVTDYSAGSFYPAHRSDPQAALHGAPEAISVLLAHQPRSATAAAEAGFDLQLSGHTHGGQFWPWNLFVPLQQPFTAGLHRVRKLWVYVSRGTGYWGPPKRFGAPSEITFLTLVPA
jgi:predicted MPP superfamily phosphohydrolase